MEQKIRKVHSVKGIAKPRASYSVYTQIGNLAFLSGQVAMDPVTNEIPKGFNKQMHMVLGNIKTILEAIGTSMENVLKMTIFLADRSYHVEYDEIFRQYFKNGYPARSTVRADLMHEDFLVEIEAIAWVP